MVRVCRLCVGVWVCGVCVVSVCVVRVCRSGGLERGESGWLVCVGRECGVFGVSVCGVFV